MKTVKVRYLGASNQESSRFGVLRPGRVFEVSEKDAKALVAKREFELFENKNHYNKKKKSR